MIGRIKTGSLIFAVMALVLAAGFIRPGLVITITVLLTALVLAEMFSWLSDGGNDPEPSMYLIGAAFALCLLMLFGSMSLFLLVLSDAWQPVIVVLTAFLCDTASMLVGRGFAVRGGKPDFGFAPSKTWVGVFGGLFFGAMVPLLGLARRPDLVFPAMVFTLPVAAILGDLLGSLIKRAFDVKDSGEVMAKRRGIFGGIWRAVSAHGGYFDRFGSVYAVAIAMSLCRIAAA